MYTLPSFLMFRMTEQIPLDLDMAEIPQSPNRILENPGRTEDVKWLSLVMGVMGKAAEL